MAEKAEERLAGEVSVGKVSTTEDGEEERSDSAREVRFVGLRARRAIARLPWDGEERMRAIPAP